MQVIVTKDNVKITDSEYQIHKGEYRANGVEYEFSSEYEGLTCKAIFNDNTNEPIEVPITAGTSIIPYEILSSGASKCELRVYGYETEEVEEEGEIKTKLKLRYSPTYTEFDIRRGSYIPDVSSTEEITPSQFEQYSEKLNQGLEELEEAIESIDVDTTYAREMGDYAKEQGDYSKEQGDSAKEIVDSYSTTISAMQRDISSNTANINTNTTNIANLTNRVSTNESNIATINTNLSNYSLISETGSQLVLNLDSSNYKIKALLKDKNGNTINTSNEIDLPLESVVVSGAYDNVNKKIVLTLEGGSTIDIPVGDLINGLQSQITSTNKLNSDLVDDSLSANKFVTSAEKTTWNNKSDFSGNYNDLSNKPTIPTRLSQLSDDSTHRLVSDTDKENWNNKLEESDLSDYVKNTDYATSSKGGVFKTSTYYGTQVINGILSTPSVDYNTYANTSPNERFISKGTLENVITGKDLTTKAYVDGLVGDISSALDTINGEVVGD